jgi:hypothetical protein
MDRSPRVTPHDFSRSRSFVRFQAGERLPEEDFHLSEHVNFQTYFPAFPRRGGCGIKKMGPFLKAADGAVGKLNFARSVPIHRRLRSIYKERFADPVNRPVCCAATPP